MICFDCKKYANRLFNEYMLSILNDAKIDIQKCYVDSVGSIDAYKNSLIGVEDGKHSDKK